VDSQERTFGFEISHTKDLEFSFFSQTFKMKRIALREIKRLSQTQLIKYLGKFSNKEIENTRFGRGLNIFDVRDKDFSSRSIVWFLIELQKEEVIHYLLKERRIKVPPVFEENKLEFTATGNYMDIVARDTMVFSNKRCLLQVLKSALICNSLIQAGISDTTVSYLNQMKFNDRVKILQEHTRRFDVYSMIERKEPSEFLSFYSSAKDLFMDLKTNFLHVLLLFIFSF
jgi:hypothetical protein